MGSRVRNSFPASTKPLHYQDSYSASPWQCMDTEGIHLRLICRSIRDPRDAVYDLGEPKAMGVNPERKSGEKELVSIGLQSSMGRTTQKENPGQQSGDLSQNSGNMTSSTRLIKSLLRPKEKLRVGAWNVRTMYETSKTAQVADEMQRYKLDMLGISECRWIKSANHQTLLEWEPISDRLIRARFNSKYCKLTIIQCYAPTNDAEEEVKDEFYEQLQMVVSKVPRHDMLLIMGDINAKVGSDNTDCEKSMGKHGCGIKNDNGERFIYFCLNNKQTIGGTIFPHKDIQKLTWKSPDGRITNQIDHITVNSKWR
ncbi:craniofacial development protein 2-like [Saccostrea cucullata]|uniref:craniofacial development protein 2-like n=1 Tax=Saccostrea cuccullata TaxID=36930 RepID=UPI002ED2E6BC